MLSRLLASFIFKKNKLFLSNSFFQLQTQQSKTKERFLLERKDMTPFLSDKTSETLFDRHYVYHPAWAARILSKTNPSSHADISSTLPFCSIVSAFIPVKLYDYRPAQLAMSNLSTGHEDLTKLSFADNSIDSLSCMYTVEHIGLGRYVDALGYDGDEKAMKELARVLRPKGDLVFVTPIGAKAKIIFNAHRIYSKELVVNTFLKFGLTPDLFHNCNSSLWYNLFRQSGRIKVRRKKLNYERGLLKGFTLIPENGADGGLVINPSDELLQKQNYGCGCFWFTK